MNLDAEKWSLLDKIHDYRFLLRLLGFALVVDLLLAVATGSNLWTFRWAAVSGRPGLILMAVIAYGVRGHPRFHGHLREGRSRP